MKKHVYLFAIFLFLFAPDHAQSAVVGALRGIVHDPDHRPVARASVTVKAAASDYSQALLTDAEGTFESTSLTPGLYQVTVAHDGFDTAQQKVAVVSSGTPVVHFQLALASSRESVTVKEDAVPVNPESMTPATLVSRHAIEATPGADLSNSLTMITAFVPGAWITHDQLHVRGGHQVTWEVDGVPVPNTNIASSVGPQIDPKDIDYLEVQRGGYSSESGDRTYGVFNVVPRTGFERNNEGELYTTFGSFHQTNDQVNFGSHTEKFAYFASLNGNRSDYGLETPGPEVLHDRVWGLGGAATLLFNRDANNQFRFVTSVRRDDYQVPDTPDEANGATERERDTLANFSWLHSFSRTTLLTASPFYHQSTTRFDGSGEQQHRDSQYGGAQIALSTTSQHHNARLGVYGFGQHDSEQVALGDVQQSLIASGHLEAVFAEDQFKAFSWLTLTAGLRATHFSGLIAENAVNPRLGGSLRIPHLNWTLRGFWGTYYQAPPLSSVTPALLDLAGTGFIPLRGERDQEHQFGLTVPVRGWALEVNNYHQRAHNYFDHNAIANSNVFFPVTIDNARLYGWEFTLHSPQLLHRGEVSIAYAYAHALASGGVTGGLSDFSPPPAGYFQLDHDQRHTLHVTLSWLLPGGITTGGNLYYGSGFTDGESAFPAHLESHTTFDWSAGKTFAHRYTVSLTALNALNRRYLLDNSLTFGGTHYAEPRQVYVQLRYRFKVAR